MGFDSPLLAALAYGAFAVSSLVLPGIALQRLLRLPVDPVLVLPLGTAFCAAAYWLSLLAGAGLFPTLVLAADLALLLPLGPWRRAEGPPLRPVLAPFAVLVALLAATQYPWNRLDAATGAFLLDGLVPFDTAFHVGLSRELTLGYPPQVPGVSGFPLGYHLGTDLVRAAALRWAGVSPFDSISRLDVTLYALGLMLALRGAAARLHPSPLVLALSPWTLLATDFSFAFAALPAAHWWADLFRGNLLLSLFVANPIVPALTALLAALVALDRHGSDSGGARWLVVAVVLAVAVPYFKVFLGAHFVLGLLAAAFLARSSRATLVPLLAAAVAAGVATLLLVVGQGGQTVDVILAPFDLARVTAASLELRPIAGASFVAWGAAWLLVSLGLRVFGLVPAVRALREGRPLPATLAVMALAAWPLGLLFRVSAPEVLPGQKYVNDAGYLLEQGGPLLWLFALVGIASLAGRSGRRPLVVWTMAAALAFPATVHFVLKKAALPPDPLPAATVRAMRALALVSRPGDLVMQRPAARFPPAPVILVGRRVPYERFTPYLTQFVSKAALEERHRTVYAFFQTQDRGEALGIARGLGARYLALYGRDRIRFDPAGALEPVHEEADARVYRLVY